MDLFLAKSASSLAIVRFETKRILSALQQECDLVIENSEKTLEEKRASIADHIASIKPKVEAIEHISNSREEALKLIDYFKEEVNNNLERVDRILKTVEKSVLERTRDKLGDGLLKGVLESNWNLIPSKMELMDPLSMSDAIQVQDKQQATTNNRLNELVSRMK